MSLDSETSVSDPAVVPPTGPASTKATRPVDGQGEDAQWRLWPAPIPGGADGEAPKDELGFARWNHVNYDMDAEDVVFCRKMRISPDHFEWIIDRLEKVTRPANPNSYACVHRLTQKEPAAPAARRRADHGSPLAACAGIQ